MAGDTLLISVDARGNAVAELKRVQKNMRANEAQLRRLTGEGERSARVFDRQRRALTRLGGSISRAVKSIGQLGIGVLAIGAAARGFKQFAVAGEKAANVGLRFSQAFGDHAQVLGDAQRATAGLVEATELQVVMNRFARLGVSVQDTTRLLHLATKASIDQGRGVLDVARVIESSLKGRTTGLVDIGVNLDKITGLTQAYAEQTGVAVSELDEMDRRLKVALPAALQALGEQFEGVDLASFRLDAQQTTTALGDMMSDLSIWASEGFMLTVDLIDDAMSALRDDTDDMASSLAGLQRTVDLVAASAQGVGTGIGVQLLAKQSEAARELGAALAAMPEHMRLAKWRELRGQVADIPPHLRRMIEGMIGVGRASRRAADDAGAVALAVEAVTETFDRAAQGTIFDQIWGVPFAPGLAAPAEPKPKAPGSGRAGAEAALAAARHQLAVMRATDPLDLARVEHAQQVAASEAKIAKLRATGARRATLAALREAEALRLREAWLGTALDIAAARGDGAHAAAVALASARGEVQTIAALGEVRRAAMGAIDPLQRAQLALREAEIDAAHQLRQLSEDENAALVERARIMEQLADAQAAYASESERIERANTVQHFTDVSRVMDGVAAQMSTLGSELAPVTRAVSQSAQAWGGYAEGQVGVGEAAAATAGAIGVASQSFIADERAKAAIAMAMEIAHSAAAFAGFNYVQGAAHLASAALFGAVAAGAGSTSAAGAGGGASAAATSSATASAGGGGAEGGFDTSGSRTVIVQFSSGVVLGRPQAVAAAVQQAAHSSRGTGAAPGW
mgnify:CR=1 FL=1